MSEAKPFEPGWNEPKPQSKGSGLKWVLLGCGGLILVCGLVCAGIVAWGYSWVSQQVANMTEEFEAKGYKKQMGQVIQVDQSPQEKTVYAAQMLKITEDIDVDIAVVCQMMEIEADIHGDVDFMGQVLKVKSGCVIDGDLRIKNAQVIEIQGEVKGKISGNYMTLSYQGKTYGPGQQLPENLQAPNAAPPAQAPPAQAEPAKSEPAPEEPAKAAPPLEAERTAPPAESK
jgi:hypothetical protein